MSRTVETKFVAVWDTDVIVPIDQVIKAMELLRSGEADFVYPYEKQFLDTSPILRRLFLQEGKIDVLEQNAKKMKEMYLPNPVGGAFLVNLKAYNNSGLENEDFYGWGMEDNERYLRWKNLWCKMQSIPGPLFHVNHERGINSVFHSLGQRIFKQKEFLRTFKNKDIGSLQSRE